MIDKKKAGEFGMFQLFGWRDKSRISMAKAARRRFFPPANWT